MCENRGASISSRLPRPAAGHERSIAARTRSNGSGWGITVDAFLTIQAYGQSRSPPHEAVRGQHPVRGPDDSLQPASAALLDSLVSTTQEVLQPAQSATDSLLGQDGLVGGLVAKLSGDLQTLVGGPADQPVMVIVQTYNAPGGDDLGLLSLAGGLLKTSFTGVSGYAATVPAGSLLQLAADSNVERISIDAPVKSHMDIAYRAIHADQAAACPGWWGGGLTGKGVGIALVDTGVQLHQDLRRPLLGHQVFEVEIVGHEPGLADYFGHGTHAVKNALLYNIRVLNLSLGHTSRTPRRCGDRPGRRPPSGAAARGARTA